MADHLIAERVVESLESLEEEAKESKAVEHDEITPLTTHIKGAQSWASPPSRDVGGGDGGPVPRPAQKRRMSYSHTVNKVSLQQEDFTSSSLIGSGGGTRSMRLHRRIEEKYLAEVEEMADPQESFKLGDILENISGGAQVIVDDDFSLCFKRPERRPWNFNAYLFVAWAIGVVVRYFIIFPLRALALALSIGFTMLQFWCWKKLWGDDPEKLKQWELWSLQLCCQIIIASWGGVVENKGVVPPNRADQIYVANHTTILDLVLLMQTEPFSAVGQLQSSRPSIKWVQVEFLRSLACIWFNRSERTDRAAAMRRIKEHISTEDTPRLIIFPEGTCVNNEYCIQFKKGAFSLGCEVCPVAIKYNPSFIDAYWISRARTFPGHLMDIMTSWAMVAEVHYLEPQRIRSDETDIEFASRVKAMIAEAAGLKNVEWNGYLKHYKPSERVINAQKKVMAERLETLYQHRNRAVGLDLPHHYEMSMSRLSEDGAAGNGAVAQQHSDSGLRKRSHSEKARAAR